MGRTVCEGEFETVLSSDSMPPLPERGGPSLLFPLLKNRCFSQLLADFFLLLSPFSPLSTTNSNVKPVVPAAFLCEHFAKQVGCLTTLDVIQGGMFGDHDMVDGTLTV